MKLRRMFILVALFIAATGCSEIEGLIDQEGTAGNPEITIALGGDWSASIQRFKTKNPDINVKVVNKDTVNYRSYFNAQSNELDVIMLDVIAPASIAAHLADLNDYGAATATQAHFDFYATSGLVNGRQVAIPLYGDIGLLYYRSDLLDTYGLAVPKTWNELTSAAQTIQNGERSNGNSDFWGFVWQGKQSEALVCNALEWMKSSGGGQFIENTARISVDNPDSAAAFERARDWVGNISPPGVVDFAENETHSEWLTGDVAFARNWPYMYNLTKDDAFLSDRFGIAALPSSSKANPAGTVGGRVLAVSRYSDDVEAASKLVLFMASAEEQKQNALNGVLPTIEAVYDDVEVQRVMPHFVEIKDIQQHAVMRPATYTGDDYARASNAISQQVHNVLTKEITGNSAVKAISDELMQQTGLPTVD